MPALRPLKSLKTSSTVRGLYCGPPSIAETPSFWRNWRRRVDNIVNKWLPNGCFVRNNREKKQKQRKRGKEGNRYWDVWTLEWGVYFILFLLLFIYFKEGKRGLKYFTSPVSNVQWWAMMIINIMGRFTPTWQIMGLLLPRGIRCLPGDLVFSGLNGFADLSQPSNCIW